MTWHVFFSEPYRARSAGDNIAGLGYEVFVPIERRLRRRPFRKPIVLETELLRQYGFVKFNPTRDSWGEILDCKHVLDVLRNDGKPSVVPDFEIDRLKLAFNMGLFDHTKPPTVGANVEVMEGPFATFIGALKGIRAKDRRAFVELNIFGARRDVEVALYSLREAAI